MRYAFEPAPQPSVAIAASDLLFPVRRIFCVGRNYAEHVKEMGGAPERSTPFFFTKPADAIVPSGTTIPYPTLTKNFHHEIELVIAIGRPGNAVPPDETQSLIFGYAVGIDLTRRDIQNVAKDKGQPWDMSKGFDHSAPCAPIHPIAETGPLARGRIWLSVNDTMRQDSDIDQMIWNIPELLSVLTEAVELKPGDLVYTGTPAGVGPIVPGDRLRGGIDSLGEITLAIAAA